MLTYTVFCVDATGTHPTTHISCHDAASIEAAMLAAVHETADDWACDPNDARALGVAAGNVTILEWEDEV